MYTADLMGRVQAPPDTLRSAGSKTRLATLGGSTPGVRGGGFSPSPTPASLLSSANGVRGGSVGGESTIDKRYREFFEHTKASEVIKKQQREAEEFLASRQERTRGNVIIGDLSDPAGAPPSSSEDLSANPNFTATTAGTALTTPQAVLAENRNNISGSGGSPLSQQALKYPMSSPMGGVSPRVDTVALMRLGERRTADARGSAYVSLNDVSSDYASDVDGTPNIALAAYYAHLESKKATPSNGGTGEHGADRSPSGSRGRSRLNEIDPLVEFDESTVPSFKSGSTTAELMQTIIHLRETNHRLQLKMIKEREDHTKELELTTESMTTRHRKETIENEKTIEKLREEVSSYQKTSNDTLNLLAIVQEEHQELVARHQESEEKYSVEVKTLQEAISTMERAAANSIDKDEEGERQRKKYSSHLEAMQEAAKQHGDLQRQEIDLLRKRLDTVQADCDGKLRKLEIDLQMKEEQVVSEQLAREATTKKLNNELNELFRCFEETLSIFGHVLEVANSCPRCRKEIGGTKIASGKQILLNAAVSSSPQQLASLSPTNEREEERPQQQKEEAAQKETSDSTALGEDEKKELLDSFNSNPKALGAMSRLQKKRTKTETNK